MPSCASEDEFNRRADNLLREIEGRARCLREGDALVDESLKLVHEAGSLHAQGKDVEAYEKYSEAFGKIEAAEISVASEPLARKLLRIEFLFLFVLLFIAYATHRWPLFGLWSSMIKQDTETAWFGALGGTTIAIFGIYDHVRKRDFDPKFYLWYLCKPVIGAIFGWFAYLLFYLGLVSATGYGNISPKPELPFAIAFLAGFSERFTIQLIDKVMGVLLGTPDNKTPEKKQADANKG